LVPKIPYSSAVSTADTPCLLSIDTVRSLQKDSFRSFVAANN